MASKRFIQLLLAIAALTAISIGLGVGLSKRDAAALGQNANLSTDVTLDFSDDCADDDIVADVPHRRLVRRRISAASTREAEWPWEAELSGELAFSMEYSMSVSGKSSKGSVGKSGKSSVRPSVVFV